MMVIKKHKNIYSQLSLLTIYIGPRILLLKSVTLSETPKKQILSKCRMKLYVLYAHTRKLCFGIPSCVDDVGLQPLFDPSFDVPLDLDSVVEVQRLHAGPDLR